MISMAYDDANNDEGKVCSYYAQCAAQGDSDIVCGQFGPPDGACPRRDNIA